MMSATIPDTNCTITQECTMLLKFRGQGLTGV